MKLTKKASKRLEVSIYVIAGIFGLAGLSLIVTGIVGTYLGVPLSDNPIASSQNTLVSATGMGYRWWGIIFLLIGALIASVALYNFARIEDRDSERNARRRERMQVSETPTVVEAKVEPKSESN